MGLLNPRKVSQTTVSVRMSLQTELLRYAELLSSPPSTLVNDILEAAFAAVRSDDPDRLMIVPGLIRKALGKDVHHRLSEEYHRVLFGTQPPETERAADYARENASRIVPLLKAAKQDQQSYETVRPSLFGCFVAAITVDVGVLYETDLMARAAAEVYDQARIQAQGFFAVMVHTTELYNKVYQMFLKEHLAREVVREIPRQFLPPP